MSSVPPAAEPVPAATSPASANEFKVYKPPQTTGPIGPRDLNDSFFTPSAADLKAAQDSLSARTQALTNAPLRTQAMRDAELKAKMAKYPTTTIRIRFTDRTQLEKTFPSTDKIRSVYAFVRNLLREDVKPIKFVLYQTPPKRELKVSDPAVRDLNLYQLQLAPASVLHLKFENDDLNHVTVPAPLDSAVLAKAEDLPLPPPPKQEEPATGSSAHSDKPKPSGKTAMPRWLKMGSNR
ncbi:Ubiquitin regulatory domain X-containing protein [Phanerochaete sordida]|uniref:Ubiquitin regulatory domain X-containing protein n=1 Tax=Phanerochaete sordida TaxID=48140 RepID=A0A9P3G038_9APHY|nr:Ubiquitin regulatory domain X-containing protein [Phanerochaete sordida]